jgi:hypothetical protein
MISSGPYEFIHEAEQSISLIEACGSNLGFLRKHNFEELFGTIQSLAINQFVLSVTKIYEKPSRRYPNLSVPSILESVEENADQLKLLEPQLVRRGLEFLRIATSEFDAADAPSKKNLVIARCLRAKLPNIDKNNALRALKTLRDKKIAHPEDIDLDTIEKTTYEQAEKLLNLPRGIVGILGNAYLATAYWDDEGSYLGSIDGSRVGRSMQRLIKAADK